jgi:hypothetical protein
MKILGKKILQPRNRATAQPRRAERLVILTANSPVGPVAAFRQTAEPRRQTVEKFYQAAEPDGQTAGRPGHLAEQFGQTAGRLAGLAEPLCQLAELLCQAHFPAEITPFPCS